MKKQKCIDGVSNAPPDLYYSLFRTSRDGLVFLDLENRILEANEAFINMVGYTEKELTSNDIWPGGLVTFAIVEHPAVDLP